MILKPTSDITQAENLFKVFLAGSIEMGKAEDWQSQIERELASFQNVCLLNPRIDDWDSSWKQEITNAPFYEQVNWELDGLEKADLIVFYFSPETQSPITLLELGLFARSKKLIVCCPKAFWRKGNVDIVCEKYNVLQVDTLEQLINHIKSEL